jgi:outer membrane protein TolC
VTTAVSVSQRSTCVTLVRITVSAMGLLLSGCISSHYAVPQARALNDPADLGLSLVAAPTTDADWWNAFQDPQLDRLLRGAQVNNPTLAQAVACVREAQAAASAVGAGIWPSISYDAVETRKRFSGNDPIPPTYAGTPRWQGSEGLNLSWDLDFWGRQSALIRQANNRSDAATLDSAGAKLAISGADARIDLTQIHAERDRIVHLLAALSGQGAAAHTSIERPRLRADAALRIPDALPFDLLARRPDVLAAHSRIVSAGAGLAAAKAAFYPDINLLAFAGTSAIGVDNLFHGASRTYGAGPALHLPVFDAGKLRALYRGNAAGVDLAVSSYNLTVLEAVQQTADQLSDIVALDSGLVQQQQSLDAAEEAFRLATERYKAGLTTYLTVLTTETEVLAARQRRVELLSARDIARVTLLIDVGGDFHFDSH